MKIKCLKCFFHGHRWEYTCTTQEYLPLDNSRPINSWDNLTLITKTEKNQYPACTQCGETNPNCLKWTRLRRLLINALAAGLNHLHLGLISSAELGALTRQETGGVAFAKSARSGRNQNSPAVATSAGLGGFVKQWGPFRFNTNMRTIWEGLYIKRSWKS